ncbi:helix-turn-helix domain-containing protein [Mycobacterium sp. 236(2023)]|uniref:helix-turn-helix domain-containing protein n=1 Tax=Mycobacterium sp. 236(2023) TaxID=3038163 RepID=UPI002414D1D1|nr:helix-turn-helix domain-containing protein [Mycobacterium sp. 236(2023)]MDG4667986.1 helix-turn-helix domain-containing protein [Mycobacterium sp. 236(2023)]
MDIPDKWRGLVEQMQLLPGEREAVDSVLRLIAQSRAQRVPSTVTPPNPTLPQPKLLLTVEEAADVLQISKTTLYRLFADGDLSWVQVGAHRRVAAAELQRFVDSHTQVTP